MKFVVLFLTLGLCCLRQTSGATHTLRYYYTASTEIPNFPEFVIVGLVDDVQFMEYNSQSQKAVPKQDWMEKLVESNPQYFQTQSQTAQGTQPSFKASIDNIKKRFNQTGGVHTLQQMYGCTWDDETGDTDGYYQYGYDGEDFFAMDVKNSVWVAVVPQAVPSKNKWDSIKGQIEVYKQYFKQDCKDWLKKYLQYGSSTLGRKVPPIISLVQRGSGVVCHATGFYPESVMITWKKDGQEWHENVDVGETVPNEDQTFQKGVMLTVPTEELESEFTCEVVHKSGTFQRRLKMEDLLRKVPGEESVPTSTVIIAVVISVVVLAAFIAGFVLWKRRQSPGFVPANTDDGSASSDEIPRKV